MPFFPNPLTDTIAHLLETGELILMTGGIGISEADEVRLALVLEAEYKRQSADWPYSPPAWDVNAGIWAAKVLFYTAQLVLYRKQKIEDVRQLFAHYPNEITPGAMLSADICLRFLPDCLVPLAGLDAHDELIGILQALLATWHYSAIGYTDLPTPAQYAVIHSDPCLSQLYTDRVIARKHRSIALHPQMHLMVTAALGQHAATFWPDYYLEIATNEQYSIAQ